MDRPLVGKRPTFHQSKSGTRFYRLLLLISLILGGIWVLLGYQRGQVEPLFLATPTPTRMAASYLMEAEAYFDAGVIDDPSNNQPGSTQPPVNDAIEAYSAALRLDPKNAAVWAELARIQAYSSTMLQNDEQRLARLNEALQSAENAVNLESDNSTFYAIRAFVRDWYAFNSLVDAASRAGFT